MTDDNKDDHVPPQGGYRKLVEGLMTNPNAPSNVRAQLAAGYTAQERIAAKKDKTGQEGADPFVRGSR